MKSFLKVLIVSSFVSTMAQAGCYNFGSNAPVINGTKVAKICLQKLRYRQGDVRLDIVSVDGSVETMDAGHLRCGNSREIVYCDQYLPFGKVAPDFRIILFENQQPYYTFRSIEGDFRVQSSYN